MLIMPVWDRLDGCQGYFHVELRYPGENDLPGMMWMTSYGSFRCTSV